MTKKLRYISDARERRGNRQNQMNDDDDDNK